MLFHRIAVERAFPLERMVSNAEMQAVLNEAAARSRDNPPSPRRTRLSRKLGNSRAGRRMRLPCRVTRTVSFVEDRQRCDAGADPDAPTSRCGRWQRTKV